MTGPRSLRNPALRRRLAYGSLAAGILAYCWLVAGIRPFTVPMELAVALPEGVVAALALRSYTRSRPSPDVPAYPGANPRGAMPWIVLTALLAFWELSAYVGSPRRDHPTLSSMAEWLLGNHPGRSTLLLLWLCLGWALFLRSRQAGPASRAQ